MANKTIGGCVRTPCPDAFFQVYRLNQEPVLVEVAHLSIWQLRGTPGARGINNSDKLHWSASKILTVVSYFGNEEL